MTKTLKDLWNYMGGPYSKELKEEAIKHLKEIKEMNQGDKIIEQLKKDHESPEISEEMLTKLISDKLRQIQYEFEGMERWIKYFFNITDEDLK